MKLNKEDVITIAVAVVAFLLIRKFYKFFGGGTTAQSDPSDTKVDESKLEEMMTSANQRKARMS